jgi:zinc transporter ZupT
VVSPPQSKALLDFGTSFLAWFASTAIPAFVGLALITDAGRVVRPKFLAAFAFGIFLWFFVDTIGGSANLYVNLGFTGGLDQAVIVLLFIIGVILLFAADNKMFSLEASGQALDLRIPLLVAIAVGVHGFGEGTAFGNAAANTSSASLLDAFGGVSAGVAYALHKALEPMMIGACYVAYYQSKGVKAVTWLRNILVLTVLFVVPSLIGAATGYYINYDATYFFALGTGTSVYAALRLAKPLFANSEPKSNDSMKIGVWLVFGFICIYFAALFHA